MLPHDDDEGSGETRRSQEREKGEGSDGEVGEKDNKRQKEREKRSGSTGCRREKREPGRPVREVGGGESLLGEKREGRLRGARPGGRDVVGGGCQWVKWVR